MKTCAFCTISNLNFIAYTKKLSGNCSKDWEQSQFPIDGKIRKMTFLDDVPLLEELLESLHPPRKGHIRSVLLEYVPSVPSDLETVHSLRQYLAVPGHLALYASGLVADFLRDFLAVPA